MRALAATLLLASCANPPARETDVNEIELELLSYVGGARYAELRDRALAAWADDRCRDALARAARSANWRIARQAKIVAGWRDHGSLYDTVLRDVESIDVAGARRTAAGLAGELDRFADRARVDWQARILPLCWEIMLAFTGEWPARLTGGGEVAETPSWRLIAAMRMATVVPDDDSIEPLMWFLEHTRHDDARGFAATALAQLDESKVRAAVKQSEQRNAARKERADGIAFALQRTIRMLDRR